MRIVFNDVSYSYSLGTPFVHKALENITTTIEEGTYVAIIGQTGSGKSTLLQHLNALILPTEGRILIGDREIIAGQKIKNLKTLRKKVGIVFQFPEHQLFEETVLKDVMFGPLNFGTPEEEAKQLAIEALQMVGLKEEVFDKSPFDLSGGQMRRVAIAGVLAMQPNVLVLDEPSAGLDPRGRKEIMEMFYRLHKEQNMTTVLVTHTMEDASNYADKIVILNKGKILREGTPKEIFSYPEELLEMSLDVPDVVKFQQQVEKVLGFKLSTIHLTPETLAREIASLENKEDQSC